ncbi:MAG TPA: alpha/beta fold hydrolase [Thermoanaerobaculia bacterium]|nr:alpha/beta fold hydrolase [Thermoanaerobaculia bacterium]
MASRPHETRERAHSAAVRAASGATGAAGRAGEFLPAWFLPGPHFQTIWGRLTRPRRLVTMRREWIELPDGDDLALDHVDSAQPSPVHFLLMHGLEGSSYSVYIQGILAVIARRGYSATVMNFRSCARDPRSLTSMLPNRRPRFYHSGDTGDFDFVTRTMAARLPHQKLAAFGGSLGGNVLLKWLGENAGQTLISAAATLSVPYDLGEGAHLLDATATGRFYVRSFLATLKKKVSRADIAPLIDLPRVLRTRSFVSFDDTATAPLHGFADANDYYTRSSSIHFVDKITTPTLALNAADDPFLPPSVLPRVKANASSAVDFRTTPAGGHIGFVSGGAPWRCEYWAEELVVRWLLDKAEAA